MGMSPHWNRNDFWHARFPLLRGFQELRLDGVSPCQASAPQPSTRLPTPCDEFRSGLSEVRLHFKLLTGLDRQVSSRRPYFIIDERLEGDRILDSPRPSPGFAIHAGQRHAAFPRQTGALPSEKHGIAKPDIQFDINGCDSARSGSCRVVGLGAATACVAAVVAGVPAVVLSFGIMAACAALFLIFISNRHEFNKLGTCTPQNK